MQFWSLFTLTLCFIIFANVDEIFARKRSEAFRRCLKQMKTSFKGCLTRLTELHERDYGPLNQTAAPDVREKSDDNSTTYGALVLRDNVAVDERLELIEELYATLSEKLEKMPAGKLKIVLMERFAKELAKTQRFIPLSANDTERKPDAAARLRDSLIEKVKEELERLKQQERMLDPKQRRRIMEELEQEKLEKEMREVHEWLSLELENRSKLAFPEKIANRIKMQVENSSSLKSDLSVAVVDLVDSRDVLEEVKRKCHEINRLYEIDVSATIDLANYLMQNIDLQIDLMTAVVKLLNHQPNLLFGSFAFDFTRSVADQERVQKASAEIYEMTRCFTERRKLHYKIKDRDWSALANKTGLLFSRMNTEVLKQNEKFLVPV